MRINARTIDTVFDFMETSFGLILNRSIARARVPSEPPARRAATEVGIADWEHQEQVGRARVAVAWSCVTAFSRLGLWLAADQVQSASRCLRALFLLRPALPKNPATHSPGSFGAGL